MATKTLYPVANGTAIQWNHVFDGSDSVAYQTVDEVTANGDTDYAQIYYRLRYERFLLDDTECDAISGTINSVTVYWTQKDANDRGYAPLPTRPVAYLNSTLVAGTEVTPTTSYVENSQALSRPGGGSWTVADLKAAEFGFHTSTVINAYNNVRVTQCYVVVDYTAGNPVSFNRPFALEYEQGVGCMQLSPIGYGQGVSCARPTPLEYAGLWLAAPRRLPTSIDEAAHWWLPDYSARRRLTFDTSHPALAAGTTVKALLRTGNRYLVGTNGMFNESVQASGGWQIDHYSGKTHACWLGGISPDSGMLTVYVNSGKVDYATGEVTWGQPVYMDDISSDFDSHYFPCLCIDNQGYVHIFYGAHNTSFKHRRTVNSNETGAFPEETGGWTSVVNVGTKASYPIPFVIPETGRIYCFYRCSNDIYPDTGRAAFVYSDDNGDTWSSPYHYIRDQNVDSYRIYTYGVYYDVRAKRLHVGYTVDNLSGGSEGNMGVWYLYCDYDDAYTEKFHSWKLANGTQRGIADTNYDTTSAVNRNESDALELSAAPTTHLIFIESIAVCADGRPIIFYQRTDDSVTDETQVYAAYYASSAWTKVGPLVDVDIPLRVRRSGIATMVDYDGVVHAWLPVNFNLTKCRKPTTDVQSVGVTRSAGTDNYALVDDDPHATHDGDATYIELASGEGNKASFTENVALPDSTPIYLTVQAYMSYPGGYGWGYACLFVKVGGTEYNSSTFSAGAADSTYHDWPYTWKTNPATGVAWTKAEAEAVEFGYKTLASNTRTFRCTQIFKKVRCHMAGDDELGAAEIWELQSADKGATWTYKQLSKNSTIGVPIMNAKHHLSGDMMEVLWCSGADVFYLNSVPWRRMLNSAEDLRLLYAGNEIDRHVDYANMIESKIRFKTKEAITAAATTGPSDYWFYYGCQQATDKAKSDPNNVYAAFDSFEELFQDDDLNGAAGWAVTAGAASIYSSPPEHANKIVAGEKSVEWYNAADTVCEKTIGSALQNIKITAYLWSENPSTTLGFRFELLNTAGTKFGVGLNCVDPSSYMGYAEVGLNGTWTNCDGTSGRQYCRADRRAYHKVEIAVTAKGCTAWFDGRCVKYEQNTITSVDKVRVTGGATLGYFDYVVVTSRFEQSAAASHVDTSITQPTIVVDATHNAAYDVSHDGKHEVGSTYKAIRKLAVTVSAYDPTYEAAVVNLDFWISNGATYDSSKIDRHVAGIIYAGSSTAYTRTFIFDITQPDLAATGNNDKTFNLPTEGIKSLKVDAYATEGNADFSEIAITQVETWYCDVTSPEISFDAEQQRGWLMNAAVSRRLNATRRLPLDYLEGRVIGRGCPLEYTSGRLLTRLTPLEYVGWSWLTRGAPVEHAGFAGRTGKTAVEYNAGLASRRAIPLEYLGWLVANRLAPLEYEQGLGFSRPAPVEYLAALGLTKQSPVEYGAGASSAGVTPLEYGLGSAFSRLVDPEWISDVLLVARMVPLEYGMGLLVAPRATAIEYGTGLALPRFSSAEWISSFAALRNFAVEWAGLATWLRSVGVEWTESKVIAGGLPIEWNTGMMTSRTVPAEYLQGLALLRVTPTEWAGTVLVAASRFVPVEFLASPQISRMSAIEWLTELRAAQLMPVELSVGLGALRTAPIDWGSGLLTFNPRTAPLEWLAATGATGTIPTCWLSTVGCFGSVPLEWGKLVGLSAKAPLEYGVGIILNPRPAPLEYALGLGLMRRIWVEWPGRGIVAIIIEDEQLRSIELHGGTLTVLIPGDPVLHQLSISSPRADMMSIDGAALRQVRPESPEVL